MTRTGSDDTSLFATRVRDLIRRAPVTCVGQLSALQIAQLLTRESVGSVVVCDSLGAPLGIVTDRDLRRKIMAEGRDAVVVLARDIMSAPLITTPPAALAFEAVLEMTRQGIHHLVVVEAGRLVGVISAYDLLRLHAAHPVTLAREIGRATALDTLAEIAGRITPLVRHLLNAGGTASEIGRMVAELNDRLTARVLELTAAALAAAGEQAPVPFCWLVLGSEARREQTLRTDQDNGLVYADPPPELADRARAYFKRFGEAAVQGLTALGFPRCPAGLMASNEQWCQPVSVWRGYFRRWIAAEWPAQVDAAVILFDLRPVAGEPRLADDLLAIIRSEAPTHRTFLSLVAREAIAWEEPFTLWGKLAVVRAGPHRGALDVKRVGVQQLVGAGQVHALEFGFAELHTIDRLQRAGACGVYPEDEIREIVDASQFLMRIRLAHQLAQIERGAEPDNWVDPRMLSRTEMVLLREALKTVERVKTRVSKRYRVGSLPGP